MSLQIAGSIRIEAPREVVWAGLNDPELLRLLIPRCEELHRLSAHELRAVVCGRVGPIRVRLAGRLVIDESIAPEHYRMRGAGEGGVAGMARGTVRVRLTPVGGATKLDYVAEAEMGGRLAVLGQRILAGAARRFADRFLTAFATALAAAVKSGPDGAGMTRQNGAGQVRGK